MNRVPRVILLSLIVIFSIGAVSAGESRAQGLVVPGGATLQANITVDVSKLGPVISPGLFGQNGAVWMPMNDTIAKLTNESGATILRWPGGETTDYYDWEADSRRGRVYRDDGTYWSPIYDTDTFIDFCRKSSCTPMVSANAVIADPQKAARWARYFSNQSLPVKLWQVGNEPVFDKHWNVSLPNFKPSDNFQPTTDEWAWATRDYAKALLAVDPEIKIIGPDGGAAEGSRDDVWVGEFTRKARDVIDFVDIHSYPANGMNEADMLATPDSGPDGGLVTRIRRAQAMIAGNASGKQLPLTMTEYNSDWNNGALMGSWVNGLYIADVLLHLAQENITIANMWNLASQNEGYLDPNGTPRSSYWAFQLLSREFTGTVAEAKSDSVAGGYGLEAYAAARSDGSLALAVVNKRKSDPYDATITLAGFAPDRNATVYLLDRQHNGTRVGDAVVNGTTFGYRFLPYSLTMLILRTPPLPPLSVQAAASPASGQAPLQVQFTSTVTGAQGSVAWNWAFGDGGSDVVANPAHTYVAQGNYTANVSVRDSAGRNATDTLLITVSPVPPPLSVDATATPDTGFAPLTVDFKASASGAIGAVQFSWEFGDGATATGPAATHTYLLDRVFLAKATAQDSAARVASDSVQISVSIKEDFPPLPPTDLTGAFDGIAVVLTWKHTQTANISFNVFRQNGSGWERLNAAPLVVKNHLDNRVDRGASYAYRVTAIDSRSRESEPTPSVVVAVPPVPPKEEGVASWFVSPLFTALAAIVVIIACAAATTLLIKRRNRRRGLQ